MTGRLPILSGAIALLTASALLAPGSVATAAPPPIRVISPAGHTGAAAPTTVTLITGDKVSLTTQPGGKAGALIAPAPGRERMVFTTRAIGKHVQVVPADAGRLLAAGRLDPRLFDVTELAASGYDDTKATALSLIVTGTGTPPALAVGALPGGKITRRLPSIDGVALAESRAQAGAFWRSLTSGGGRYFASAAVGKVWLNARHKVVDADSNAQIGVPAARAAGYDGKGVTVGVLDTGVDATHPDLKGVLGETKDFTDSTDGVKDDVGHGTHVSSIIAGSGTGNPAYAGVAPGATVIVGKVCGTESCDDAAVIAGMEWIAGKARVVNISLGTDSGSDGTDPVSQSLNALTASTGTLFAVAAGNAYSSYTVGSPAAADAALAVASVGRTDAISRFSSKGPRLGDSSVKPDIAAPGEDIVAARAAGTSMGTPVGDLYTSASGTSMATPHVTGVAALLAQAHPDWTASKLKAALMSSAAAPAGVGVFDAGAGRVDAARAVTQSVFADGNVSFPLVSWPRTSTPLTRTMTYRNEGNADVALSLALSDQGGPFSIAAPTLTVPAKGSADATIVLDPAKLPAAGGAVGARITATAPGVSVRTAVGVVAEPETYEVQLTLLDRTGKPASNDAYQSVSLYNYTRHSDTDFDVPVVDGVAKVRVPAGDYAVSAYTATPADDATGRPASTTMQIITKLTVDRNRTLTLDARKGARTSVGVADRPRALQQVLNVDYILGIGPGFIQGGLFAGVGDATELYAVPTRAADGATLAYGLSAVLGSPAGEKRPYAYYLTATAPAGVIPAKPVWSLHTKDLAQRKVRFRAQGKPADGEFARSPLYLQNQFVFFGTWVTVSMPTTRTDYLSPQPREWSASLGFQRPAGEPRTAPFGWVFDLTGTVAAGKPVPEDWNKAAIGPSLELSPNYASGVYRYGDQLGVYVPMFSPAAPRQGNHTAFQSAFATGDTTLALEGDEPVASGTPGLASYAGLPAADSRYTLTATATRTDFVDWSDLSQTTEATWSFRSAAPDSGAVLLPLMYVRTTGPLDDLDRAPAGLFPLSIDVLRQPRSTTTATVRSVSVEYSTDDGKTWKRAPVVGSCNRWGAVVINPRSGFVSLRTSVADSAGDTHSSTVIHAYGIR